MGCAPKASGVESAEYFNDIFVYDAHTDAFGGLTASASAEPCLLPPNCGPYPQNNNVPQVSVNAVAGTVLTLGGEVDVQTVCGEIYQHYPTLALQGTITVLP